MRPALQAKPRVLYICGWGRSGSTVVDRIFGEVPGFTSVGELRSLWDASPLQQRCGCGELITTCSLWGPLLSALTSASGYTWQSIAALRDQTARSRHLLTLWRAARRHSAHTTPAVTKYGDVLTGIYAAVQRSTGAGVVVDSSKHPAEALLLASRPDIDLTVLHLVRDPRAVAYSWNRRSGSYLVQDDGSGDRLPQRGVVSSSAWWTVWNGVAEALIRPILGSHYVSLRYEDVMTAPRQQLGAVVQRLGGSAGDLPFVAADEVSLGPSHTVAGNPNRMGRGTVKLSMDMEWQSAMGLGDKIRATAGALPMLRHFGYHVLDSASSELPRGSALRR